MGKLTENRQSAVDMTKYAKKKINKIPLVTNRVSNKYDKLFREFFLWKLISTTEKKLLQLFISQ